MDALPPEYSAMKDAYRAGAATGSPRFALKPFEDIRLGDGARYLVRGLIPREGLVVIWGPPKCGKSFLVSDMMLAVARGERYRARLVEQGAVVYLCLEGERGFAARIEAYRRERLAGHEGAVPFFLITTRLDLAADADALIDDIRQQLADLAPAAVAIDTLNRSLGGSESSDEDMSRYVRGADKIRDAFGCVVIIVHHCGHDATRPRGHTSLIGACDAEIAVAKDKPTGIISAIVSKMKDGVEGAEIHSRLKIVELGTDEDGDMISSCIVEPVDSQDKPKAVASKPLNSTLKLALEKLDDLLARDGQPAPANEHIPAGATVVSLERWRDHLRDCGAIDGDGATARQQWSRARKGLTEAGLIAIWQDFVWKVRA